MHSESELGVNESVTLFSTSLCNLSLIIEEVNLVPIEKQSVRSLIARLILHHNGFIPSRPLSGLLFGPKVIEITGGDNGIVFNGSIL